MPRTKKLSDADVVRAMSRVLLRRGTKFTLADVGDEVGLSPATLLQRFGSKRGLMRAFTKAAANEAALPFELAAKDNASPLAALHQALQTIAADYQTRQEVANGLATLLEDLTDEAMRREAARHAVATERAIGDLLAAAVSASELVVDDPRQLAITVQAAWNGAVIQWALRDGEELSDFLETVLAPLLPRPRKKARRRKKPNSKREPS